MTNETEPIVKIEYIEIPPELTPGLLAGDDGKLNDPFLISHENGEVIRQQ